MQENRVLKGAFLVSLLLHLVLAVVTWKIPLTGAVDPAHAAEPSDEVEIFLVDDQDVAEDTDMPTAYTSIPERQAVEEPPEDPDYLSTHHSLAADNKMGDGDRPSAEEEWISDKVEIRKEELDGADGVAFSQQPLPETEQAVGKQEAGADGPQEKESEGDDLGSRGEWMLPSKVEESGGESEGAEDDKVTEDKPELEKWWGGEAPSVLKEGNKGSVGDRGFDFNQPAKGKVTSGVAIDGDFSLNTYEWDYAPWMKHFENELRRHWNPPYAYKLGVISGMTLIKLVVEKDGRPSVLEIIDTEGHPSLHDASLAALKAFTPYAPLPAHFPEENLVITLGLHYPNWR